MRSDEILALMGAYAAIAHRSEQYGRHKSVHKRNTNERADVCTPFPVHTKRTEQYRNVSLLAAAACSVCPH